MQSALSMYMSSVAAKTILVDFFCTLTPWRLTSSGNSGSATATGSDDVDFTGLVMDSLAQAQGTIQGSEQASAASVVGQADLVDVVTAVSAAEVTLETVVAVRDPVVKAYQEILRMPI